MEEIGRYCALCMQDESEENLRARYRMILKARKGAYCRPETAKTNVAYMERKVKRYESILDGRAEDDSKPKNRTEKTRPHAHKGGKPEHSIKES